MPSIPYGTGCYDRTNGNLPPLKLINMYVEKADTSEGQICLLSRPGLAQSSNVGTGPSNGIFCEAGTLGGDKFILSGNTLYRETTSIGTIGGTGPVSFAGSDTELLITRGGSLYSYNGTNLATVAFPDGASVRAVFFIGERFVALRGDGLFPGRFYWSALLDGRTWDGLDYATNEREPDDTLDALPLGDNGWFFGQQTIESWTNTGDLNLPFSRIEQVAFDQGILATGCVCAADNSLFFIGSKRIVYRIGDTPQRVSHNGIEEKIEASAGATLFSFWNEGHEFVALRLDSETFLYDCSTGEWCEVQTNGGNWIAQCAAMKGGTAYFGHSSTGQVMIWSGWDDLGMSLERRFTAAQQMDEPMPIDRVSLWANTGQTPLLTGLGSAPLIELRSSDDAGNTWTEWDSDELGSQGDYRQVPEWRALGLFDFPGVVLEFRVTDPVPLRVSAVKVNDIGGGRSR